MDFFPLHLFPEGALDSSVITTVWVGVMIVAIFNLRLGWVLSGLVVPGYLVPLLIARPFSAVVVVVEAIVTYLIVILLSGPLARMQGWGSFFGRDRFFALVLVSVIVRVLMDGWLLPAFGAWLTGEFDIAFDYRNNLHSFGLIIIALMANQFWKTGLLRGMVPLAVTVGLTYLVVRYLLMEFTNFRVSGLSYMFEDVTSSILASPKAYIILLTTAFVASRMNLFYGWEFNGILIPSLLALQWYEPTKIVFSFAEAFLILGIGTLLLRVPFFRDANIEGARKLLLFFNISFVWKIFLSYGLIAFAPTLKVSDFFAFGYLLSTLMAVKMHDKAITLKLTWSTLTTSFVAIVIASIIGFSLTLIPQGAAPQFQLASTVPTRDSEQTLTDLMKQEKRRMYGRLGQWESPLPLELESFREALETLRRARSVDDQYARVGAQILATVDYELVSAEDRYLVLHEGEQAKGWGVYVIDTAAVSGSLIEVPGPLHETGTLEAALWLFLEGEQSRALGIGGPRRTFDRDAPVEVLLDAQNPFSVFHQVFDRGNTVQVRGYRPSIRRLLTGQREATNDRDALFVTGEVPAGLNLGQIRERTGELDIRFVPLPVTNEPRNRARGAFAELLLSSDSLRRLAAGLASESTALTLAEGEQSIQGYLEDWLLNEAVRIAPRGSDAYQPPDVYELLFFDEEVLTPLIRTLQRDYVGGAWTRQGLDLLDELSRRVAQYDYRIVRYRHLTTGQEFLVLGPAGTGSAPYWGTYVFRAGTVPDYVVQVPRPLYERNSLQFGLHLFERMQAFALLVAGTHPAANSDGSADVTKYDNRVNLFNLVNQVLVRERGDAAATVIQARSQGVSAFRPVPDADMVLSTNAGIGARADQAPGVRLLINALESDGFSISLADGSAETAGLEAINSFQALYQRASVNKSFALVWLSPLVAESFADQQENERRQRDIVDTGIETTVLALRPWTATQSLGMYTPREQDLDLLHRYTRNQDINALFRFTEGKQLTYIQDLESRQGYLALWDGSTLLALANLEPVRDEVMRIERNDAFPGLTRFINRRAAWLVFQ